MIKDICDKKNEFHYVSACAVKLVVAAAGTAVGMEIGWCACACVSIGWCACACVTIGYEYRLVSRAGA